VRLLKLIEKASARMAHHVIISNHLWKDVYIQRSASDSKCTVFVNQVNTSVFHPRPRTRQDDKLIMMFPGGLQWHQGLDIAIEAFAKVASEFPKAEFHIYGDGNMKDQLVTQTKSLGLEHKVLFYEPLPVKQIAELMSNADIGVVPKRADSFGNEAYSTKIMEFMAAGVPVIVSETKIDRYYFTDCMVRFFKSGNIEDLANAMREFLENPEMRQKFRKNGTNHALQNNWEIGKFKYLALVDSLLNISSPE
jgi:glycosyltransferase involved in cell wall biosynthesis